MVTCPYTSHYYYLTQGPGADSFLTTLRPFKDNEEVYRWNRPCLWFENALKGKMNSERTADKQTEFGMLGLCEHDLGLYPAGLKKW